MKLTTLAAAAALAVAGLSAPAFAQDAAPTVGATVFGPDGAEVGTIEKVEGENVVVNTGTLTATLPAEVLGAGEKGPTIGWNKAELEAAVTEANQQAEAALQAALAVDAEVYSSDGQLLGKVKELTDEAAVVTLANDGLASLPKSQFALQADKLTFLATAADVEAAVAAQAQAPAEGGD